MHKIRLPKKLVVVLVLISLAFSPLFYAPTAQAQSKKTVESLTKRYGTYLLVNLAVGAVFAAIASIPTTPASPGQKGDAPQALRETAENTVEQASTYFDRLAENFEKIALEIFKRRILDKLVDGIVKWIQEGPDGKPKFVDDWGSFFEEAANEGAGDVLREVGLARLCEPFSDQLRAQLKIALFPTNSFTQQASCTLDQVVDNIQEFYDDFSKGGFEAYLVQWSPENNIYGSMLLALNEAQRRGAQKKEAAEKDATAGGGFLSVNNCDLDLENLDNQTAELDARRGGLGTLRSELNRTNQQIQEVRSQLDALQSEYDLISSQPELYSDPEAEKERVLSEIDSAQMELAQLTEAAQSQQQNIEAQTAEVGALGEEVDGLAQRTAEKKEACRNVTPGAVVGQLAAKAVGSDFDYIINARELEQYTTAIANALTNRLLKEGFKELKKQSDPQNAAFAGDSSTGTASIPDDLIQGGQCTTDKGERGVFIVEEGRSEFVCLSVIPSGGSILSAQNIKRRVEMIDAYRAVLQHAEWLLLLKTKTKRHYVSIIKTLKTLKNIIPRKESPLSDIITCKDGTVFRDGDDLGTTFNLERMLKNAFISRGISLEPTKNNVGDETLAELDALDEDIENLPRLIDDVRNRLNILQAPAGWIEEKPYLHSVHGPVTRDLIDGDSPGEAFEPIDPIITPFHSYGEIPEVAAQGPGFENFGKEIGMPVLLERLKVTGEPSLGATIRSDYLTSPLVDAFSDASEDLGPQQEAILQRIQENISVPDIKPLPLARKVQIASPLANTIRSKASQLRSAFDVASALLPIPSANLQVDEGVYGKTTLDNRQIDALYKSFIKFSLERLAMVSVYTNKSHPGYQLDLKKEEYRSRALHEWLFTRNLYDNGELGGNDDNDDDDRAEFLKITSPLTTFDQINLPPAPGPQQTSDNVGFDWFARIKGGGLIGRKTVINLQDAPTEAFRLVDSLVARAGTFVGKTPENEDVPLHQVGLFTWCTGYPIFNPELF